MYPEYIGVLLSEVAELRQRPRSAAAAYDAAQAFERKNGFSLLEQTPFSDANALGVKPAYAKRHGLRTIADLRRVKGTVKVGALPEFATRFEGIDRPARRSTACATCARSRSRAAGATPRWTAARSTSRSVFTTEGQLAGDKYVVLADPRGLFASGHVAPIVSRTVLDAHGADLQDGDRRGHRALTTTAMRRMNAAVDLNDDKPAARRRRPSCAPTSSCSPGRARPRRPLACGRMADAIRVAVCDDARAVKFFLRHVLEEDGDIEVVSATSTGAEALAQLATCPADVLLLDLVLPDVPEPAMLVSQIRERSPRTAIVLISNMPPFSLEKEAERLQTDGWMPKAAKPAQLRDAVRRARCHLGLRAAASRPCAAGVRRRSWPGAGRSEQAAWLYLGAQRERSCR